MEFCETCRILLKTKIGEDTMTLYCPACSSEKTIKNSMVIKTMSTSKIMFDLSSVIDNLIDDPTLPRIRKPCLNKDCDGNILSYIRNPDTGKIVYYICDKCKSGFKIKK